MVATAELVCWYVVCVCVCVVVVWVKGEGWRVGVKGGGRRAKR